ncbi:hypothetical protein BU23DRAFT_15971 [Bimuria novae-zelandiae CBS 107.79]|uniref:Uncharacterized protein n=1 Tax=Bimuria novae-zelandiae CBS 107.79 TaxID=1447943 RepID=A0A6A5VJS4_9PLEO|nr:hypothetical protein BU23DRAFT_15971 [Bimuria novae-zelandiae CBS 107.79]
MPNHSPLHESFVTRGSDWPMVSICSSYAFARSSGNLRDIIRPRTPTSLALENTVECVHLVGQCSSTLGRITLVGCWQFPWSLTTLCVSGVPRIAVCNLSCVVSCFLRRRWLINAQAREHYHTVSVVRYLSRRPWLTRGLPAPSLAGWRHCRPVTLSSPAAHPLLGTHPVIPCRLSVVHNYMQPAGRMARTLRFHSADRLSIGLLFPHPATVESIRYAR